MADAPTKGVACSGGRAVLDFSRLDAALIASSGKATSMSFLRVTVIGAFRFVWKSLPNQADNASGGRAHAQPVHLATRSSPGSAIGQWLRADPTWQTADRSSALIRIGIKWEALAGFSYSPQLSHTDEVWQVVPYLLESIAREPDPKHFQPRRNSRFL